ncbi:hypothetical protein SAICODRAFT_28674 [Saitoella complicata NRRL Y-17804]|uniref:Gag1-like clamp domain-containing protein n=1 Tax=Saitoella complicata (strain BCRC 22490 / CBS 7301 / JCM 7358 / NBRC 10748 / NRRL Y-17804) TaxID=698492 RepID=A0A0E9N9D9_SAICN|nr:uncharacterized protein SAICODRAFT_28674 [Saitoella complicata NRRL Y-17804]ODQ56599.1 hypothetical protein SAICODRAFT_28674 [Saitoella complicata NRRL Y-17804]GAO46429.1 hypothetical protein G7K_0660-t1 [Saitoella complicata NRRL Y-17804]
MSSDPFFDNPPPDTQINDPQNDALQTWLARRQAWLRNTPIGNDQLEAEKIRKVEFYASMKGLVEPRYESLYDELCLRGKSLKQPMNLATLIPILKAGWIRDGLWAQAAVEGAAYYDAQRAGR